MVNILCTGGAGFIGSNLATMLVEGNKVVVLDNFSNGNINNLRKFITGGGEVVQGDIMDYTQLKKVIDEYKIEQIYHLAASSSSEMFTKNSKKCIKTNIMGTFNVFKAAQEYGIKKVCYASTSTVYAGLEPPFREEAKFIPENWYTLTKTANEHTAHLFHKLEGVDSVGFRFFSVYGPNDAGKGVNANMITQFMLGMKKGEQPILFGDGLQTRDFIWVEDVCEALTLGMANKEITCDIFNVGTGIQTPLTELVPEINEVLGTDIKPKFEPNKLTGYVYKHQAWTFKAENTLGFKPKVLLKDGLNKLKEFYDG